MHHQRPKGRWFGRGPALEKDTARPSSLQRRGRSQMQTKTQTNLAITEKPDKVGKQETGCKCLQGGEKAGIWRTSSWDVAKADSRQTQGGHLADTRRAHGTWRTQGRQAWSRWAQTSSEDGLLFFLRENPTVNCPAPQQATSRQRRGPHGRHIQGGHMADKV